MNKIDTKNFETVFKQILKEEKNNKLTVKSKSEIKFDNRSGLYWFYENNACVYNGSVSSFDNKIYNLNNRFQYNFSKKFKTWWGAKGTRGDQPFDANNKYEYSFVYFEEDDKFLIKAFEVLYRVKMGKPKYNDKIY